MPIEASRNAITAFRVSGVRTGGRCSGRRLNQVIDRTASRKLFLIPCHLECSRVAEDMSGYRSELPTASMTCSDMDSPQGVLGNTSRTTIRFATRLLRTTANRLYLQRLISIDMKKPHGITAGLSIGGDYKKQYFSKVLLLIPQTHRHQDQLP